MGFLEPAALLFALPLALLFWRTRPRELGAKTVRALALLALVLALAGAFLPVGRPGRDLVVVVDRSRSMPADADERALELIRLAESQRESGDRVAVVTFGEEANIAQPPREEGAFPGFQREDGPDGSDLAGALDLALGVVPKGRPARILLVTDGAATTDVPEGFERRAQGRGIPIDVRALRRDGVSDLAVERIDLPETVGEGEPFQFSVWVRAARPVRTEFRLVRAGRTLSSGEREFEAGLNRLVFRDVLEEGGVAEYAVDVASPDDTTPENNRGLGSLRAVGPPRVLVLCEEGVSTLVLALRERGLLVDSARPEAVSIDPLFLTAYRSVVLENVDAGRVGETGMYALADFVTERGGGLLVTGGTASFGRGGYYRSPLDPILPVSMELRQEHRKLAIALSIVMDRSGSMTAPVDSSRSKMDLANAGAAAAIESLSEMDSVSAIAVDQEAHVIRGQSSLEKKGEAAATVRRIRSEGGGIYVYNGLVEAVRQLKDDPRLTKHIILFADAADSEQQEGCEGLLAEAAGAGVTCSVIALGTERDPDAAFLRRVGATGRGSVTFTTSPTDLPRLFAQDTMQVARANFVDEPTATRALPGLLGLGDLPADDFPGLGGYNLTYLRPESTAAVVTTDEFAAPVVAFVYRGLGRAAAFTGQIGGTYGASVAEWDRFSAFAAGLVRFTLGTEEPGGLFATVERRGSQAVYRLELDPDAPIPAVLGRLAASALRPDGSRTRLEFERVDAQTFEAQLDLGEAGTVIADAVLPDGTTLALPPVSLPYSPEFQDQRGNEPKRLLDRLARGSGGHELSSANELFVGERGDLGSRPIQRELVLAALLLVLFEITMRRLSLWVFVRVPRRVRRATTAEVATPGAATEPSAPRPVGPPASKDRTSAPREPATRTAAPEPVRRAAPGGLAKEPREGTIEDALAAARRRAKGRLGRGEDES
ncbi:MAG: VWA domain-containing protein [Planctomycetota bacterium]